MDKGTYQVALTFEQPSAGEGACCTIRYWPGTKEGATPPETLTDALDIAFEHAEKIESEGLPHFGKILDVRVTSFEQLSEEDPLMERPEPEE